MKIFEDFKIEDDEFCVFVTEVETKENAVNIAKKIEEIMLNDLKEKNENINNNS